MAVTGRDQESLAKVAARTGLVAIRSDMRRVADSRETAVRVAAQFGGIDVLFVNAGVGGFAPVSEVTEEFWDGVHQVNRRGASPEEVVRMRTIMQNAVPMQRLGEATFITGIDLFVDGGCVES